MSKANFWQRGESLDYKNNSAVVIEANTIISLSTRIGVAGTAINPSETGSVLVCGVYEVPKKASEAISMGTNVYFDGAAITATATGNTPAGYAVADAVAADDVILVKLLG